MEFFLIVVHEQFLYNIILDVTFVSYGAKSDFIYIDILIFRHNGLYARRHISPEGR